MSFHAGPTLSLLDGVNRADINLSQLDRVLDDDHVRSIAEELGMTPAQLLISWALQRNTVVLPKSVTPDRIISNLKGMLTSISNQSLWRTSILRAQLSPFRLGHPC